jgi:hypothetical protein
MNKSKGKEMGRQVQYFFSAKLTTQKHDIGGKLPLTRRDKHPNAILSEIATDLKIAWSA